MTDNELKEFIRGNQPEVDTIRDLHRLIRHGSKCIDIRVRKDAKEYLFEGDWIRRMLLAVLGEVQDQDFREPLPEIASVEFKPLIRN